MSDCCGIGDIVAKGDFQYVIISVDPFGLTGRFLCIKDPSGFNNWTYFGQIKRHLLRKYAKVSTNG